MADIRWFMNDQKQFLKFCELLGSTRSDSIFGTEIVNHVMHEFWSGCFTKLLWLGFIPYCVGLVSYLMLIHDVFTVKEFDPDAIQSSFLVPKFTSLLFIGYQIF